MSNVSMINGHIDEPRMTNYDRIKNMSVDELAEWLVKITGVPKYSINEKFVERALVEKCKQWLESEVSENDR